MASKYADKKNKASCAYANCPEPGASLVLVQGRPQWVCTSHKKG